MKKLRLIKVTCAMAICLALIIPQTSCTIEINNMSTKQEEELINKIVEEIYNISSQQTAPQIAEIAKENADATRTKVLSEADSFTEYTGDLNEGIAEVYIANNKSGMVVTSTSKSFGGTMTVMVGIDPNGAITGVEVTGHADTAGLGTKSMTPEFLAKYNGIQELTAEKVKDQTVAPYVVGASVSSGSVYTAVKGALQQFADCGGIK